MAMMGIVYAAGGNSAGQLGDHTTKSRPFFEKVDPLNPIPPVTAVAAGSNHSLALCVDGSVRAWGKNDRGQLGDSTTSDRHAPVTVLVPSIFQGDAVVDYKPWSETIAVAAGSRHSLALRADGTVWAWGANDEGQVGDGTTADRHTPVAVLGVEDRALSGIIAIVAGSAYSVALRADGTVWAWGANGQGQLGDGTTTDRPRPVLVKGLTRVSAIAARGTHTLALVGDGRVTSWGSNDTGQLGDGTTTDRPTPGPVTGPDGTGRLGEVVALAAGAGYSLALRADGTVWGWGQNAKGQLGDGTTKTRLKPVEVHDVSGGGTLTGVTAIAAGAAHSMALQGLARVFAWGWNNGGRLGDGTTIDRHAPVLVANQSQNTVGAIGIAAGQVHSLVVAARCNVRAWGSNSKGQLASTTGYYSAFVTEPFAVASAEKYDLSAVAAGEAHSLALRPGAPAASEDTTYVRSWGWNANGQLGGGGTEDTPQAPSVPGLAGVKALAAGDRHSLALTTDGTVWAWGANGRGQLGIDSTDDKPKPVHVADPEGRGLLSSVVAIAARGAQSLALRADGTVWAWGANDRGQLGDGTVEDRHLPVSVQGLGFAKALAAGGGHGLALRADGTVWAWGAADRGQLGNTAFPVDSSTPVAVKGQASGDLKKALAAGHEHSLALRADGTVWGWGANGRGQLGDGTTTDRLLPVQVSAYTESYEGDQTFGPLTGVWAIAAGGEHSLAIDAAGKGVTDGGFVRCWGANDLGQLGTGTTTDRHRASAAWPETGPALRHVAAVAAGHAHSLAVGTFKSST